MLLSFTCYVCLWSVAPLLILLAVCVSIFSVNKLRRWLWRLPLGGRRVAFFHPYCLAGGGGERVLWTAVAALAARYPRHCFYVYCDSGGAACEPSLAAVVARVERQFGLHVPAGRLQLVRLQLARLLRPQLYPLMTVLGESVGSLLVAVECLFRLAPDVFIDTMGCSLTMPAVAWLCGGCARVCYVHYPTVSSSMMSRLAGGGGWSAAPVRAAGTRLSLRRRLHSLAKYSYYAALCVLYGWAGRWADVVICNGTWTARHIGALWRRRVRRGSGDSDGAPDDVRIVFPPCDVTLCDSDSDSGGGGETRDRVIVSVAQFRPEKDHQLQLYSFAHFIAHYPGLSSGVSLTLAGSCRDSDDQQRVRQLQLLAHQLQLSERVSFEVNVSRDRLQQLYSRSLVGLHTMLDEHFGIGVVDMMSAGLLVVGHDSGGPRHDIICDQSHVLSRGATDGATDRQSTGFLASSAPDFAAAFAKIFSMPQLERQLMRQRARKSVQRFTTDKFCRGFLEACNTVL